MNCWPSLCVCLGVDFGCSVCGGLQVRCMNQYWFVNCAGYLRFVIRLCGVSETPPLNVLCVLLLQVCCEIGFLCTIGFIFEMPVMMIAAFLV